MVEWEKEELRLHSQHGWRAKSGCKIFVANHGAVRFDYPDSWVVIPDDDSVKLYDKEPPNDDSRLAVSYLRLPSIDWSGLALSTLIEAGRRGDERPIHSWGPIVEVRRGDLELAWREVGFIDPVERREAKSRMCIGRRSNLQCLITFDFWESDISWCSAAWDVVLETLELGEYVSDPAIGPVIS
jgi:hypothetical protein